MCIKAGKDELETVRNLMSMGLKAVVADALRVDLEEVVEPARLAEDLNMDSGKATTLQALIAEMFDGVQLDLRQTPTFAALLERVVLSEFRTQAYDEVA